MRARLAGEIVVLWDELARAEPRALWVSDHGYPDGVGSCGPGASNGGTSTFPPSSVAFAEVRVMLALEPLAVAGQRPTLSPAADARLPPEHRFVEGPRPFDVTGVEAVDDQCAGSLTGRAPLCSLASQTPNAAPSGSVQRPSGRRS